MKTKPTNEDFLAEIDRIKNKKTSTRKNSKRKGSVGERELVNILNERFKPRKFMRTPDSGARVGGVNYVKTAGLEEEIVDALAADIITPKDFKFLLEHKNYSKDAVQITHLLRNKETDNIRVWWNEIVTDAAKTNRLPMLVVKLDRAERFCMIYDSCVSGYCMDCNYIVWNLYPDENLRIVALSDLLHNLPDDTDDSFWFD